MDVNRRSMLTKLTGMFAALAAGLGSWGRKPAQAFDSEDQTSTADELANESYLAAFAFVMRDELNRLVRYRFGFVQDVRRVDGKTLAAEMPGVTYSIAGGVTGHLDVYNNYDPKQYYQEPVRKSFDLDTIQGVDEMLQAVRWLEYKKQASGSFRKYNQGAVLDALVLVLIPVQVWLNSRKVNLQEVQGITPEPPDTAEAERQICDHIGQMFNTLPLPGELP